MKKTLLILLFISIGSFSQHTERYLKLMENFIFQDSIKIEKKYKNGNRKFTETLYTYKIKGKKKIINLM